MSQSDYIQAQIARLEAYLADLARQRQIVENEQTLMPGTTRADDLRDNWRRAENQRSGLRGIDQARAGAEQQLAFYRRALAE